VYFAVLTLTFGQMLYFYALGPGAWLTNGDNGFSEVSISGVLGLGVVPLDTHVPLLGEMTYVLVAALTLLAVAAANRIVHSPYGLIFKALGENQQRVAFVGLNVDRYKLTAFVISAAFAGVGGALFTVHEGYIHPNSSLYWIVSGDFVIMTVLGGTGSLVGPMLGAFIFEYISNVVSGITLPVIGSIGSLWRLVLGAVFVVIVWALPRGVGGALRDLGGMVLRAADDDRDAGTATDGGEER
jgi:branched-chain amino acid transport system permease protein